MKKRFANREPAKRGESIKPGVERSGTPGSQQRRTRARETGGSHLRGARYSERQLGYQSLNDGSAIARFAGWVLALFRSWGSAPLHPRLYAFTRSAGLGNFVRSNLSRASE